MKLFKLKKLKSNIDEKSSINRTTQKNSIIDNVLYVEDIDEVSFLSNEEKINIEKIVFNTNVKDMNFIEFVNLCEVETTENVKSIGKNAFSGCKSLTSVKLNDGLVIIGESAFKGTRIQSLILPSTLKKIDMKAFMYCDALSRVQFNDGLTMIDSMAFYKTVLKKVVLPKSLQVVRNLTFALCKELEYFELNGEHTVLSMNMLQGSGKSNLTAVIPEKYIKYSNRKKFMIEYLGTKANVLTKEEINKMTQKEDNNMQTMILN